MSTCVDQRVDRSGNLASEMATTDPAAADAFMKGNEIDGKAIASQIRLELTDTVAELKEKYKRVSYWAFELL